MSTDRQGHEQLRLKHPYRVPGLDGTWRITGLETTNLGEDGRAKLHLLRVDELEPHPDVRTLIADSSLGAGLEREIRAKVAAEIRAEAQELRRLAKDAKDRRDDGDPDAARHLDRFLAKAVALEQVAGRVAEGGDTNG